MNKRNIIVIILMLLVFSTVYISFKHMIGDEDVIGDRKKYYNKMTKDFEDNKECFGYVKNYIIENKLDITVMRDIKDKNDIFVVSNTSMENNKIIENDMIQEQDNMFYDYLKLIIVELNYSEIYCLEGRVTFDYVNNYIIEYTIEDKAPVGWKPQKLMDNWYCTLICRE